MGDACFVLVDMTESYDMYVFWKATTFALYDLLIYKEEWYL